MPSPGPPPNAKTGSAFSGLRAGRMTMFRPILRPVLRSRSSQTGEVAQRAGLDTPDTVQAWGFSSTAGTGVRLAAVSVERRAMVRRGRMWIILALIWQAGGLPYREQHGGAAGDRKRTR